jgi:thiamine biosynthesis lipoprotein
LGLDRPTDLHRFSHEAMATYFEIYAVHPDAQYVAQASQAAFDLVDRLERELSRFQPTSDITRINHLAAGERTRVTPSTLECLVIARHLFALTGGAFDVSIGSGLETLEIDAERVAVRATRAGVRVDLGGIGKGYAVDLVGELLEEWGIATALVHGGFSSMLALAPPPGSGGWSLTLSDPAAPARLLERLSVTQAALSASGIRKTDHIVDPRTGEPVRGRLAAWALVPRPEPSATPEGHRLAPGAVADALTTALMLLAEEEIAVLCEGAPGLHAWALERPLEPGRDAELRRFGAATERQR